jgi:TM2 domain-containing membrane protein YozV
VGMVLWLVAVVVAIFGLMQLLQGEILWGILLLVLAAAIGPGGWSIFSRRTV